MRGLYHVTCGVFARSMRLIPVHSCAPLGYGCYKNATINQYIRNAELQRLYQSALSEALRLHSGEVELRSVRSPISTWNRGEPNHD
jgi:hypothetical protein